MSTYHSKKALFKCLPRKWDEVIVAREVYVIPSNRLHDSGYHCIDFVALTNNGSLVRFGGSCDSVSLEGSHFCIDSVPPDGIIRIWNNKEFTISHDASSISFAEKGSIK